MTNSDLYSKRPNLVLGFHGCDKSIVDKVINGEKTLIKSGNEYDWLGGGIYFWQNSKDRALEYATRAKERKTSKIKEPAVIGAILDLGLCLDLLDYEHLQEVKSAYSFFNKKAKGLLPENKMKDSGIPMLRYLDKAVIQTVHTIREVQYNELVKLESLLRTFVYLITLSSIQKDDTEKILKCFEDILKIFKSKGYESFIDEKRKKIFIDILAHLNKNLKKTSLSEIEKLANEIRMKSLLFQSYDSVRSTFLEGESLYENAGFREKNHIQICIRNMNCIKGYFLPKNMDECYPNP
ncbi:MAG: hypothetical protein WCR45_11865 [Bacteroidaceae bacterium]|nr:hypothetical protein [Bacteroidaceae bacterium]